MHGVDAAPLQATATARPARWWDRVPDASWPAAWDRRLVALLVAGAGCLRLPTIHRGYWVDEGISIGIAGHPLSQLPGLLRHDGSPPLFYALLHVWLGWFGTGEAATHALSLLISLGVVVVAWRCGRTLFGRTAGLAAALLAATNPYLDWYATETRMYTLLVGLGLVAATCTVRALRHRRPLDAAGAVAAVVAAAYTHNWGLYLGAAIGVVVAARALLDGDRSLLRGLALAGGVAGACYLPWLPSFLEQARTTAAPWAVPPGIGDLVADPASLLGGTLGIVVLPLLVLGALWTREERRTALLDDEPPGAGADGVGLLVGIGVAAVVMGWLAAQVDPSWTVRYLGALLGPLLLAAAGALAATSRGRAVVLAVAALCTGWSVIGSLLPNPSGGDAKSNVRAVALAAAPDLHPGDVVVVTQTEQLAALHLYLPAGLTYVTPTGPVADPTWVDWRDLVTRLRHADACQTVAPAIAALPPGADVLLVSPLRDIGASGTAWYRAANGAVRAVDRLLALQPSLVATRSYTEGTDPRPFSPVVAELFTKQPGAVTCP